MRQPTTPNLSYFLLLSLAETYRSSQDSEARENRGEPSDSRGAADVPEPLTINISPDTILTTYSEKLVRVTRPALVCAGPKTNIYTSKFCILTGSSSLT